MRIVLDVSTTWSWSRPATGIVRTEQRFADYLLSRSGLDVAFCRFDRAAGIYREVGRDRLRRRLDDGPVTTATASPISPAELTPVPSSSLKTAGRKVLAALPEAVRDDARRTFRGGRELFRGVVGLATAPFRAAVGGSDSPGHAGAPVATAEDPPFRFAGSDVYLSMGMDWDYNDLAALDRRRLRDGFRVVLFCHDIIPIRFPHLMPEAMVGPLSDHLRAIARVADQVVAVSETSRRDFLEFCYEDGDSRRPPVAVPPGTDLSIREDAVVPPTADLAGRPFILCVGTIEARKNHEVLYHVWERLAAKHGDRTPTLVIVGWMGWGVADLMYRLRANPALRGHVRILNDVGDGGLIWLYRHCLFTVYPSIYEGWGLPVVESLALGKPCIGSTAPAVVEASQGMTVAVDPHDVPEWVAAVERLWLDERSRDELAERLRNDYRAHSWQDHGDALIRVAQELSSLPRASVDGAAAPTP